MLTPFVQLFKRSDINRTYDKRGKSTMKQARNAFLGATAVTLLTTPAAIADTNPENRGASTVEFLGVDCSPENGEDIRVLINNFYETKAIVTVTELNGNVVRAESDIRMNENIVDLSRLQLEQLASTAGPDEGQNIYSRALEHIKQAEEACKASTSAQPSLKPVTR